MGLKSRPRAPSPPVAHRHIREFELHGDLHRDPYDWLRDKTSPEVLAYLSAENAYLADVMAPLRGLEAELYQELVGRVPETDVSVPYRFGDHLYYVRTEAGKQYAIHCRRRGSLDAPEEVILDLNELAWGEKFIGLGAFEVSDDGNLLAYTIDNTGFREFSLYVEDLRSGAVLADRIRCVKSVAWAADNRTLFYVVDDRAKRPYRLFRHQLGSGRPDDLVYEETDDRFMLAVTRTRSRAFVLLEATSHTTGEVQFVPADRPDEPLRPIAPRAHGHEYDVDHAGDRFYIRTNDRGRNFRIVTAPVAAPGPEQWTELVPHRADVMIEQQTLFAGHCVLNEIEGALPQLRVIDLVTAQSHRIELDEEVYSFAPAPNMELQTPVFRFNYQSFVTPSSHYDYDMRTRQRVLLKRDEVIGHDPARYRAERVWARAHDGARIPISLVRRADVERDGRAPMLLITYGAYAFPHPAWFAAPRLSLLDRGAMIAIAHIRGGGELGKDWHDSGRMMRKHNSFDDFVAAAEHLIAERYTSRSRLVIQGGSAGGLVMGVVANTRPDLCKAIVSFVPFVDVINTMLDESLPLTVGEFEEFGNPRIREHYEYMKRYCPYTNLRAQAYPAMLVRTALNDSQVMYWEPVKYVAKLRAVKTDDNPLLLHVNMDGGHAGASGRYDRLRETALDFAFVLWQMGLARVPRAARPGARGGGRRHRRTRPGRRRPGRD
jgi:oligopeptidase B